MNAIYYHNKILSTKYAGEADALVTEIFFAFIFAAYTIFTWELSGSYLSIVLAIISLLCLARVIYGISEWVKDSVIAHSEQSDAFAYAPDNLAIGPAFKKVKFVSRRFNRHFRAQ